MVKNEDGVHLLTLFESKGLSDKWTTEPGCVFIVL